MIAREIKFRVWDKGEKQLKYLDVFAAKFPSNWKDFYELQQYTGLLDRNGKEVYEGDIINRTQNNGTVTKHTIIFSEFRFAYSNSYFGSIALNKAITMHQRMEVIGNIYETEVK